MKMMYPILYLKILQITVHAVPVQMYKHLVQRKINIFIATDMIFHRVLYEAGMSTPVFSQLCTCCTILHGIKLLTMVAALSVLSYSWNRFSVSKKFVLPWELTHPEVLNTHV